MWKQKTENSRLSLAFTAALLVVLNTRAVLSVTPARPPNFVIIFTDDQGYQDLGCFGSRMIKTPKIDRMAAEGVKFTDFYVAAPLCTPSRAALMTGSYPGRVGLAAGVLRPNAVRGLNPDEITLPELLKTAGYRTACIGKWHLGFKPPFTPAAQGFDEYFGLYHNLDEYEAKYFGDQGVPLVENGQVAEQPADRDELVQRYTRKAVQFIRENRDRPFFLYLAHTMPHVPLGVSEPFRGKSRGGLYGDVIEEIDWSTGRILDTVRELELGSKTLVVYTSDNGPSPRATGSARPLRGRKHQVYEGGMRVPCIVWGPGRVPAGRTSSEVVTSMDLYPTFARLAGAELPADRVIDGRDVYPLMICEPEARSPHAAFFYHDGRGWLRAVRAGPWKLHLGARPELYNLKSDVGERRNLVAAEPETAERLRRLATEFEEELSKTTRSVGIDTGYVHAPGIPVTVGKAKAVDGLKVAYDVRGKGDVALVFIHGWACDRTYWHMQLDEFAGQYRVVAIDLGGHGQSGSGRHEWSLEGLSGDVQAVTDRLGLKRWILIGHSMGGPVALAAARRTPGRTIGVVGVDTLHDAEFRYDKATNDLMLDQFQRDFEGTMSGAVRMMFRPSADPAVVEWVVRKASSANGPAVLATARSLAGVDFTKMFSEARVPIRCINAAPGTPYTQETKVETNRKYADFEVVLIEDTGHFLMLERPRRFNALLGEVLKQLVDTARAGEE